MKSTPFQDMSKQYEQTHQTWLIAAERLDYLRASKAINSSSFIQRQYEHALWEFNIACSARKEAKVTADHQGSRRF
jgi:hypothetical protein